MKKKKDPAASLSKDKLQKQLKKKSVALEKLKRELEIEAALERVRTRTMSMQKSDELQDAAIILFQQMQSLGIPTGSCGFNIWDKDEKAATVWMSSPEGGLQMPFNMPHTKSAIYAAVYAAMKNGDDLLVKEVNGRSLEKHFDYLLTLPGIGEIIKHLRETDYAFPETMIFHFAFFNTGYLSFHLYERYSDADDIFKRFAKVFEQTYTRFLDLQKAEAQAKESQIELSLERVRARAMAMQKSDELSELVDTVFKELTKLDFALTWCIINIIDESSLSNTVWAASPDIGKAPESYYMKFEDYPFHRAMMKGWKERKTKYVYVLEGLEKKTYDEYLFNETEFRKVPKEAQAASRAIEKYVVSFSFSNFGGLQTVADVPLSDANLDILSRFGKVFDLTYTRFNDLKLAEAQTREAQIETSLERVRSKTMAMHSTRDVGDTVAAMFDEFVRLGMQTNRCGIVILSDSSAAEVWTAKSNPGGKANLIIGKLDMIVHPLLQRIHEAWKKKESFYTYTMEGNDLRNYYQALNDLEDYPVKFDMNALPSKEFHSDFYFPEGWVFTFTEEPIPDEVSRVIKRFSAVFGQTYRRFLDLQKAEAQTREAQIELSLERVRAKTMAMHNSQDVGRTVTAMFEEVVKLGIDKTIRCGIAIIGNDDMELWTASSKVDGQTGLDIGRIDLNIHPMIEGFRDAWKSKKADYHYQLIGEDLRDYYRALNDSPGYTKKFDLVVLPSKIIHNSFFFPEGAIYAFSPEPLTAEASKIYKRFAGVFGQTYRRFLDLQKAEAQARHAQIEAAMEKVRARSLAMQKPEELIEVAEVLRREMGSLGVEELETSSIYIVGETTGTTECWYAIKDVRGEDKKLLSDHMIINLNDTWVGREMLHFYSSGEKQISILMQGENRKEWINYCAAHSKVLQGYYGDEIPERTYHLAKFSYGYMGAASPGNISPESWDLIQRATAVFSLAYTRFLDLQKAAAQTREAQIELALERVRARTMAMFKSDELAETSAVLFHQLIGLGIEPNRLYIGVIKDESGDIEAWATDEDGIKVSQQFILSSKKNVSIKKMYDGWKAQKKSVIIDLQGKELENYFHYLINELHVPFTIGLHQKRRVQHMAYFSKGFIGMAAPDEQPQSTINLLERFASVFNLTYTRFTDLQQAEAQAREAKIETGLERVRSRAMAMHKTDELLDAAELVYKELSALGVASMSINYAFVDEEEKYASYYSINPVDGKIPPFPFVFPHTETDVMRLILSNWKKQEPFSRIELDEEATLTHQRYIAGIIQKTITDNNIDIPFSIEAFLAISPKKAVIYTFNFSKGYLFIIGDARLTTAQEEMVLRFTKVFEMAYRRFLDLKQAEAQARESQIEAALERVRGKAMAMHNSNDLSSTASMVFTEFRKLGINPMRSGVALISKEKHIATLYGSTTSSQGDSLTLVGWVMLEDHPVLLNQYNYWLKKEDYFPVLRGELLKTYYEKLSATFSVPPEQSDYEQYGYFLMFSEGFLFCWSQKPYSETEIKILSRFKAIIDLTFRRYLELQKSEANAREAVKQAALDRVRADIASMRTPDDLEKITPLIWSELTVLGIPFIRCGVFIMDEQLEQIHTFLSTPDGKAIAAFHIPYSTTGNINQVLLHWKQRENYINHWDELSFIEFADTLVKQGALASSQQYLQSIPHGGFHLHFLPFLQGMLYVGNSERLADEEIKLIQSVADAFSTAYARYEDFNKLEAAKQTVEKTLVDLKLAQTQLVQSEKMASLGELTAGIAHEIQNPLNFVNNFSEVSNELIGEMVEEVDKGHIAEVKAIAEDIKQNLEKINHHGKRADAIVKGMLQHSRSSVGVKELTDINALAHEYLRLSYHGLRGKDNSFDSKIETDFDHSIGKINIIPQDIGRVLLNVYNNAFYAVNEKKKTDGENYQPAVSLSTKKINERIEIRVKDNGNGIAANILDKIFQPFFTTKPTGQGTGLGLSMSYDIIKTHGGEIRAENAKDSGVLFTIAIPIT